MSDELKNVISGFTEAYMEGDVERTLSFLDEEVVWDAPEGIFRGKEEVKRLLAWSFGTADPVKFIAKGIGIMVNGNRGVYEYTIEGNANGMKYETPGVCVYEFNGDKIQGHRVYFDRLSVGSQVAKGWLSKTVVNVFVNRMTKGLAK